MSDKLIWRKNESEIEITDQIIQCAPVGSHRIVLENFLNRNGAEFSDFTERMVYASVKIKSRLSFYREKMGDGISIRFK